MQAALLNDAKGLFFEYLVGLNLAIHYDTMDSYLLTVNDPKLREYELKLDPSFLEKLKKLADISSLAIIQKYPDKVDIKFNGYNSLDESDLMLGSNGISLKLTTKNSFINTKSGGISSFIDKYFNTFDSNIYQEELNKVTDTAFSNMAKELHLLENIPFSITFNYWKAANLPILPGKLNLKSKHIVLQFYYQVIIKLYEIIKSFYKENPSRLIDHLYSLIGRSSTNIIQLFCFYRKDYQFDDLIICDHLKLKELEFIPPKNNAFFYLKNEEIDIQIRVKPMDSFISKSLKVNCSIRYKKM